MKTRIIFSIIAFAISGGLLASCHRNRTRTVIHRTVVVQRAISPLSLSGKTITFDYSQAEYRSLLENEDFLYDNQRDILAFYYKNVPWGAYHLTRYALARYFARPRMKFKGDSYECNVKLNEGYAPTFSYTYRKSGESTAIIKGGGPDGRCEYILTFDTPRSGTATFWDHVSDDREELRYIRFSIK